MKKISIIILFALSTFIAGAKKVKFAVDMRGIPINATGMHVSGDFQTIAGFAGGDWNSSSTSLTIESVDSIYSIVVDLPAFAKYEYKFLNGDQFYDAEFVPVESRIGYNFNDSRWIYVDSIADDTSFVGAIKFAANAPDGMNLVRFIVNTSNLSSIDVSGIHIAGDFQAWDPLGDPLYSFVSGVWEKICYLPAGTYEYKYINGNILSSSETVPLACAVNNNRQVIVSSDVVLSTVCYNECICNVGVFEIVGLKKLILSPNPMSNFTVIESNKGFLQTLTITDISGRVCFNRNSINDRSYRFENSNLVKGIYTVKATDDSQNIYCNKLIIE